MGQIYAAVSGELGANRYEKFKLNQYFVLYQITAVNKQFKLLWLQAFAL